MDIASTGKWDNIRIKFIKFEPCNSLSPVLDGLPRNLPETRRPYARWKGMLNVVVITRYLPQFVDYVKATTRRKLCELFPSNDNDLGYGASSNFGMWDSPFEEQSLQYMSALMLPDLEPSDSSLCSLPLDDPDSDTCTVSRQVRIDQIAAALLPIGCSPDCSPDCEQRRAHHTTQWVRIDWQSDHHPWTIWFRRAACETLSWEGLFHVIFGPVGKRA